jgi:hypothetical protein
MGSPVGPPARREADPGAAGRRPEPGWLRQALGLCAAVIDADPVLRARVRAAAGAGRGRRPGRARTGPGRPGPSAPSGRARGAAR